MHARIIAMTGALVALTIAPRVVARAQSNLSVGANAGAAIPTGDLANVVNTGYTVGITLGSQPKGSALGFRAEGAFNEFGGKGLFNIKHRVVAGTANLTYDLMPAGTSALYGIGGVGIYGSYDNGSAGNSSTRSNFGFNVGGGYRFSLSGFNCYVEARYHSASGGSQGTDSFVPIVFGLSF